MTVLCPSCQRTLRFPHGESRAESEAEVPRLQERLRSGRRLACSGSAAATGSATAGGGAAAASATTRSPAKTCGLAAAGRCPTAAPRGYPRAASGPTAEEAGRTAAAAAARPAAAPPPPRAGDRAPTSPGARRGGRRCSGCWSGRCRGRCGGSHGPTSGSAGRKLAHLLEALGHEVRSSLLQVRQRLVHGVRPAPRHRCDLPRLRRALRGHGREGGGRARRAAEASTAPGRARHRLDLSAEGPRGLSHDGIRCGCFRGCGPVGGHGRDRGCDHLDRPSLRLLVHRDQPGRVGRHDELHAGDQRHLGPPQGGPSSAWPP